MVLLNLSLELSGAMNFPTVIKNVICDVFISAPHHWSNGAQQN